jgi:hypothetical protein
MFGVKDKLQLANIGSMLSLGIGLEYIAIYEVKNEDGIGVDYCSYE